MAKKTKKSVKTQKPKNKQAAMPKMNGTTAAFKQYVAMLSDPCAGPLAAPPYAGTDSGYMIRTHALWNVQIATTGKTSGTVYPVDVIVQWTPGAYSTNTGIVAGGNDAGSSLTLANLPTTDFISSTNSPAKQFRAVASCARWVPTGPYQSRQGSVGLTYTNGMQYQVGDSGINCGSVLQTCTRVSTSGSENHEVKWLPTDTDEAWTYFAQATLDDARKAGGTLLVALKGVDATATTTTQLSVNGYVELYTVWEWVPDVKYQVTRAVKAPLGFTTQQVLNTLAGPAGELGNFLYGRATAGLYNLMPRLLTSGISAAIQRASDMPQIAWR